MGFQCRFRRKISTICMIVVMLCAFGIRAILATSSSSTSVPAVTSLPTSLPSSVAAIVESVEELENDGSKLDLDKAETAKNAQKVEIIKQIQKLNNDGSYTVGYEAEDGTFKIESRDVLGNVKGTYGYVDSNGEIKRVSYTANNGTGLKSTPVPTEETVHIQPRLFNRSSVSSTTRRPLYPPSTTASPTRPTVIQTIPKRLRVLSSSVTERSNYREHSSLPQQKSAKPDPTTTVVYATSVPTPKTYVNIRPTPLPGHGIRPVEQIARPEKLEIHHVSKVQLSPNRDTSTSKPVVEEVDEKEEDRKPIRGNSLRRQLMGDNTHEKFDAQSVLYTHNQASADESSHVYGPTGSTSRPLFTTTSSPRIPALVLAARNRATQIQNSLNANAQNSAEKYYVKQTSTRKQDVTENDPTTEPTSEHLYLTQTPIAAQIPPNRVLNHQSYEEEKRSVRRPIQVDPNRQRAAQYARFQQAANNNLQSQDSPRLIRIPIPQNPAGVAPQQLDEQEQYLRETTQTSGKNEQIAEQEPVPVRIPQGYYKNNNPSQYYVYPQEQQSASYYPHPNPTLAPQIPYSYRGPPVNPPYYDYPERPLTTRDFERLLQLLVFRHQQLQRFGGGYIGNPNYGGYSTTPYPIPGYSPYIRQPFYSPYDPRFSYRPPLLPYPTETENMYQAQNPIAATESPMPYDLQRLIPRKKMYSPRYFGAQNAAYSIDDYAATAVPSSNHHPNLLPPDVREELLYRMLMLALQTEPQPVVAAPSQMSSTTVPGTPPDIDPSTTTKSPVLFKKPVRSVQILGEEDP